MSQALEKLAYLPFGLVVDKWRWDVFSGKVTPKDYNRSWWQRRLEYQGVAPPAPRNEEFFDPGAKYHVQLTCHTHATLAQILQFQFHRDLSRMAGCRTMLHRCSIYDSKEVGKRLIDMMTMGASRPWPDALETLTGSSRMDATAMMDYSRRSRFGSTSS